VSSDIVIVIHIAQAIAQASSLVLDPVVLFHSQGYIGLELWTLVTGVE
jgi:hypothetical protein